MVHGRVEATSSVISFDHSHIEVVKSNLQTYAVRSASLAIGP